MKVVEGGRIDPKPNDAEELEGLEAYFGDAFDVKAPLDIFDKENLVTIALTVRRPPEMEIKDDYSANLSADDVAVDETDKLLSFGVADVAYKLSSLVIRREEELAGADDLMVIQGKKLLEDTLRMLLQLDIMKSRPSG